MFACVCVLTGMFRCLCLDVQCVRVCAVCVCGVYVLCVCACLRCMYAFAHAVCVCELQAARHMRTCAHGNLSNACDGPAIIVVASIYCYDLLLYVCFFCIPSNYVISALISFGFLVVSVKTAACWLAFYQGSILWRQCCCVKSPVNDSGLRQTSKAAMCYYVMMSPKYSCPKIHPNEG